MKRHGHLWDGMISFENLLRAAEKARRGKRFRPPAARFYFHLERELTRLHEELATQTYRPGPYRTFTIYEGMTRQISAAPSRDRVVHHALTGVLEPIFERSFVHDSYACRKGKGTHTAVDRCVLKHRLDESRRKATRQKEARAPRRAAGGSKM